MRAVLLDRGDRQDRDRGARVEALELARSQLCPELLAPHDAIACSCCAFHSLSLPGFIRPWGSAMRLNSACGASTRFQPALSRMKVCGFETATPWPSSSAITSSSRSGVV